MIRACIDMYMYYRISNNDYKGQLRNFGEILWNTYGYVWKIIWVCTTRSTRYEIGSGRVKRVLRSWWIGSSVRISL